MSNSDLARVLSEQPTPMDQEEIQERMLNRLNQLSQRDPVQLAKEYQAESLKRLARMVENASGRSVTHDR